MFALLIGVNQEHPDSPSDVRFREKVEKRLRGAGYSPRWDFSSITVKISFPSRVTDHTFIATEVKKMLDAAEVPNESLSHIHVFTKGALVDSNCPVTSSKGQSTFYISALGKESYCCVYPRNYPLGLDHVLETFQHIAEWFTLLATIFNRAEAGEDLIRKKHNIPGGLDKIGDIPGLLEEGMELLGKSWGSIIEPIEPAPE